MDIFDITVQPFSGLTFWALCSLALLVSLVFKFAIKSRELFTLSLILFSFFIVRGATPGHSAIPLVSVFLLTVGVYYFDKYVLTAGNATTIKIGLPILLILLVLGYCKYKIVYIPLGKVISYFITLIGFAQSDRGARIIVLGISYVSFKLIHYLVDSSKGKFRNAKGDVLTFINYIFFFPSYFSGPINRYKEFCEDSISNKRITKSDISIGVRRIIDGLFKKIVLADNIAPYAISSLNIASAKDNISVLVASIYAYGFFVYFDFAGYSDLAIGTAQLFGIRLPENFNYPFLRRNIQQFWVNWHMSLTAWLTDYLYWPITKKLRKLRSLKRHPVTVSAVSIFITFVLCGIWHGDGLNYVLWGTYHGGGLAILNVYRNLVRNYGTPAFKKWVMKSKTCYVISTFITFNFVSWGFLLFACDMHRIQLVLSILYQHLIHI